MPPWIVVYEEALGDWGARQHSGQDQLWAVLAWLLEMVDAGPPAS